MNNSRPNPSKQHIANVVDQLRPATVRELLALSDFELGKRFARMIGFMSARNLGKTALGRMVRSELEKAV